MILVFIFLIIIIIILIFSYILIISTIKLEINKLCISNKSGKLEITYIADIAIYIGNKVKIFKFTIDNEKIKNLFSNAKLNIKKIRENSKVNKNIIKYLKCSNIKIEYFKIDGYFSTTNAILTTYIYTIISALPAIIVASKINGEYTNNVQILNINENKVNIDINCIFNLKSVNIINIIYLTKGGKNNNGKSSNRRSYAYGNE